MNANNNPIEGTVVDAQGQQQVQLMIDERNLNTSYANAFRSNGTAEEVMLDFGINQVMPPQGDQKQPGISFQVMQRVILNYYSAKRLALALGQIIQRHEAQFGELELDPNKRIVAKK
jgi:hypothetical protein